MSGFGQARELTGQGEQSALGLLYKRNATLKPLFFDPSVVIFAIRIGRYQWVEGYTRSMIYEPKKSALD